MNRPGAPLFATINITGFCNLKCKYCFYQPRSNESMGLNDFKRIIDELSELKLFFVNISGGEPFTHPLIDDILIYAHKKFQHVIVLTNGTILLKNHLDTIKSILKSKRSFPVQVSLDAIDPSINMETRCDPEKVLNNIQLLCDMGANVTIATVLTVFNKDHVQNLIVQLSSKTKFFHIMPLQRVELLNGRDKKYQLSEDDLYKFWVQIERLRSRYNLYIETPFDKKSRGGCASGAPCAAAFSYIVIDPTLKVRPCDKMVRKVIGDLKTSTISDIWNNANSQKIIQRKIPICCENN